MHSQKKLTCLPVALLLMTAAACGPSDNNGNPVYGEWNYDGMSLGYQAHGSMLGNNLLESDCDDNNKLFLKLGSVPTQETHMKVVRYGSAALAADEVSFDITHGEADYLSTGLDNKTVHVTMATGGRIMVNFDNIQLQKYSGGTPQTEVVTVTGYIQQQ